MAIVQVCRSSKVIELPGGVRMMVFCQRPPDHILWKNLNEHLIRVWRNDVNDTVFSMVWPVE